MKHLPFPRWSSVVVLLGMGACNLLHPLAFLPESKRKVPAEFDKLRNRRAAVLVWVPTATLFDYPHARLELATYVADKLAYETAQRDQGTSLVVARDVEDFLQRNADAQVHPQLVGKKFDCHYVIYLEVLQFHIRDPNQPQMLRATIEAAVTVHDIRADAERAQRVPLETVKCEYPTDGPVLMSATNSMQIREGAYRKFAEMAARKFYDHTEDP